MIGWNDEVGKAHVYSAEDHSCRKCSDAASDADMFIVPEEHMVAVGCCFSLESSVVLRRSDRGGYEVSSMLCVDGRSHRALILLRLRLLRIVRVVWLARPTIDLVGLAFASLYGRVARCLRNWKRLW